MAKQFNNRLRDVASDLRVRVTEREVTYRVREETFEVFIFTNDGRAKFKAAKRTADNAADDRKSLLSFEEHVSENVTARDVKGAATETESKTLATCRSVFLNPKASAQDKRAAARASKSVLLDIVKRLGAAQAQADDVVDAATGAIPFNQTFVENGKKEPVSV